MPELPEVETTRRGIERHVTGRRVTSVIVREPRLRWPVPGDLAERLTGRTLGRVLRRAKYLLIEVETGLLLLHLGMSGSLRVVTPDAPLRKHDHIDLCLDSGRCLRLHDPRRFGAVLWIEGPAQQHPLLAELGPEPLGKDFDAEYLYRSTRKRRVAIKQHIMNSHVVVGVGNIYASEALFLAGIRPGRAAGRLTRAECARLVETIRQVLGEAIAQGGTTLRDFVREDGSHGYFQQHLRVYGRTGLACIACETPVKQIVQGNRSSYYCPVCQR
ncbi:bifunctional DNA-formamidopyrimidine glycosylase/DNA-(apurinic or apyrimidinic site) lyase [Thioalkalivibrio sulfidiphilus]|uniref:bifunctional DNA-formamidopyrimidine glycosylase/DNA-(apurinic or apyrimidinic site) lyase n=1 Tax=Thioalkalivibrio sulfidiphilus TaxID=1033854 RepID=UPI00037563BE|nr:bifunctional DNA-formamidopyrimidine glycosylase/DNA-(apurinic or apyrimidinic site) lyase [Thioalkalivibrio sulfidiphilus]